MIGNSGRLKPCPPRRRPRPRPRRPSLSPRPRSLRNDPAARLRNSSMHCLSRSTRQTSSSRSIRNRARQKTPATVCSSLPAPSARIKYAPLRRLFVKCILVFPRRPGLQLKLLELVVETHAWAATRPEYETRAASTSLDREMDALAATEREQGIAFILTFFPLPASC